MANASGPPHFPPKFQQIKILTNEDCISADKGGEEISAVYYGGATGAVPFMWESQPGTPKHKSSSHTPLSPPLTPPPSHQFITTPRKNSSHKNNLKNSKFPNSILSRIPSKKVNASPSLSLSSSSSSSSSSSFSHFLCSTTSPSSTPGNELHNTGHDSPSPTTCFGNINGSWRRIRGYCYTTKRAKKVVLSIDAPITLS